MSLSKIVDKHCKKGTVAVKYTEWKNPYLIPFNSTSSIAAVRHFVLRASSNNGPYRLIIRKSKDSDLLYLLITLVSLRRCDLASYDSEHKSANKSNNYYSTQVQKPFLDAHREKYNAVTTIGRSPINNDKERKIT